MCYKRQACEANGPPAKKIKNTCENVALQSITGSSTNDSETARLTCRAVPIVIGQYCTNISK